MRSTDHTIPFQSATRGGSYICRTQTASVMFRKSRTLAGLAIIWQYRCPLLETRSCLLRFIVIWHSMFSGMCADRRLEEGDQGRRVVGAEALSGVLALPQAAQRESLEPLHLQLSKWRCASKKRPFHAAPTISSHMNIIRGSSEHLGGRSRY